MSRDWRLYLEDMLICCSKVLDYTRGLELPGFLANAMVYDRVSKNAVFGLNFLPGFWTWQILWIMPILTGFGPNPRGPKSGQGKLADLDALSSSGHVT